MNRTQLGFTIAALYNIHIIVFSRGFSDVLGEVDPTFGSGGSVGILLWGLAYLALRNRYAQAPAVALVFAIEKLYFASHWALWMSTHAGELPSMFNEDPLTGFFYAIYGAGDALFMAFFGWVAWAHWETAKD